MTAKHGKRQIVAHALNFLRYREGRRRAAKRVVAEGAGFEPAIRFPAYTLSRRAPSAARPPLLSRSWYGREARRIAPGVERAQVAPAPAFPWTAALALL